MAALKGTGHCLCRVSTPYSKRPNEEGGPQSQEQRQEQPRTESTSAIFPQSTTQLVSRISSSAASLKALATSFHMPSVMKVRLLQTLPKHYPISTKQRQAQPSTTERGRAAYARYPTNRTTTKRGCTPMAKARSGEETHKTAVFI